MKPVARMTAGELAAFIQEHLRAQGINVVLTGGAVVSIHSQGKYVSKDIDLVVEGLSRRTKIRQAMAEIGFEQAGRHYAHPEAAFLVEFPGGPLSVGKQPVGRIDQLKFDTGVLKLLSPTDCVKDRLAAYYYWGDRQALEQAVVVAQANPIDMDELASWSEMEGKLGEFHEIQGRLKDIK